MTLDNLNKWLTLIANLGVLIGIIVVAVELRQNQVNMEAEASTKRAEMAFNISETLAQMNRAQQQISELEIAGNQYRAKLLRYFENLHFQRQIGVLNDEVWQANLNGIKALCGNYFRRNEPELFSDRPSNSFGLRASFVELIRSTCNE